MRHKVFYNAGAGSLPEPEASASSTDVSSFLQTLTDRQLEVMLGGLHQMFTKDEMTRLNTDIEKIVTAVSVKAIVPALSKSLNVDARSFFIVRPGSSNLYLESVTKKVSDAIVKTLIDTLEENQASHKLELHKSVTEKTDKEDAQSAQCSSDTSLISSLLVDQVMAYMQKVPDSSCRYGLPAVAVDHQRRSFLQSRSAKSLHTLRSEHTRTKAAHEVSKILFMTADRFLESSLHSQRAHTSPEDCSEERSPSECLFRAYDLVDCVIDGICERLQSQYETLDWMESGADVSEVLWYIACTTYYRTMRHLKDFSAVYQQKSPEFDPPVSPKHAILLPEIPTPQAHLHKPTWFIDTQRRREMASMATFLDTMMASLGLQSSGHLNSVKDISAAAERVDGLFSTAAAEKFAKMLQLMLTDRCCEKISYHSFLFQSFATEFLSEFADEAVKRLLTSCIAPRAASIAGENVPTLVMPFRACPESFDFSRPPSEMFDDTIDLFSDVIVKSVMDKISELSDYELSNAEETHESESDSSEQLRTSPPTISVDALRCCIRAILQKVQEMSSTGTHGSPLLIDEDQVQDVTTTVKGFLSLFTAVTVEDGEHAVKKLHRSIIDAVYIELIQRIRSENQLIEAVKTQSELLAGSLAVSIALTIKHADSKDLYHPSSVQSGSSSSIKEEPSVSSQPTDDVMLPNQDSSRGLVKSDSQHRACLTTWLVLRILGQSELNSSDLRKEASSDDPKELIERILRELSASSSAAKLEEVLNGTFDELLQRFGEEGSLHKALDPRDPAFDEALMTALRKHLGADASTAVPEAEGVKNMHSRKRKGIFFRLKMPKLSMFKKKSRKDNSGGHPDQDPLQSRPTAAMGGSSSVTSKKEKPRKPSIFSKMFSCFRKSAV